MSKKEKNPLQVMSTFLFPNGMVITCGWDDKQIPELQGEYTPELHEKIKVNSDARTKWSGFENATVLV